MLKRKLISVITLFLIVPALILICFLLLKGKQYYLASVIVIILSFVPFFASLERKKLKARELVAMASIVAIAVASRAAFFMLPQVKPTCAIVIIAAIVFGPEMGFTIGAMSMLLSNIVFGQGTFTPFQMLGMGLVGFICGALFYNNSICKSRWIKAVVGGVLCFAIYGFVVDTSSALFFAKDIVLKSVISVYSAGIPFNLIHGAATFIVLALLGPLIEEKLVRIKIKYDLFGSKESAD